LQKGPGFGRRFPRRRRFTGTQAHDSAAYPRAVAGAHFNIADQPVAFVEQGNDRHTLRHWRGTGDPASLLLHNVCAGNSGFDFLHHASTVRGLIAPGQHGQQGHGQSRPARRHPASGRQAS